MFEIGDIVEVCMRSHPQWNGLIGTLEKQFGWGGYRIRFPDIVPGEPHSDPYILNLSTGRIKLCKHEIIWEV